jgi:hypothetical protein
MANTPELPSKKRRHDQTRIEKRLEILHQTQYVSTQLGENDTADSNPCSEEKKTVSVKKILRF